MKRVCIFCQMPRKLTREHVWPDWLKKHLPVNAGMKRVDTHQRYDSSDQPVRHEVRSGDYASMKLQVVCGDCNSGWMSRLQTEAMPALVELIHGRRVDLASARLPIANWCTMLAMVLEMGNPQSVLTKPAIRLKFKERLQPPAAWFVLVGISAEEPALNRQAFRRSAWVEHDFPFYKREPASFCTVVAGRLVFQVQGCEAWTNQRHAQMVDYASRNGFVLLHPEVPDTTVVAKEWVSPRSARGHTLAMSEAFANVSDEEHGLLTHWIWPDLEPPVLEDPHG